MTTESFTEQLRVNVDNSQLSDTAFRAFVRSTLPVVKPQEWQCSRCHRTLKSPTDKCVCWFY